MSEQTLFNLIMAGITALVTISLAAITAWKTAKLGAHAGAVEAIQPIQNQLDESTHQLRMNATKLQTNTETLDTINRQTNSQLDDFKKLLKEEAAKAIAEAIKEGIVQGIEQERQRAERKVTP